MVEKKHDILWTGGYDSTFRVLDLVLNKKRTVQPHYIIDENRSSTKKEIDTINSITAHLYVMDSEAAKRIKAPVITKKRNIVPDENIKYKYEELISESFLGTQYVWLPAYLEQNHIDGIESGAHKDDNIEVFLTNYVERIEDSGDHYFRLKDEYDSVNLSIFSRFRFPLLEYTKLDMEKEAREGGFNHLMEMTWFCFRPQKDGQPCGLCNPCQYAKEEGMGRRVPKPRLEDLIVFKLRRFLSKLKYTLTNEEGGLK